jgi:hypothetical protein
MSSGGAAKPSGSRVSGVHIDDDEHGFGDDDEFDKLIA